MDADHEAQSWEYEQDIPPLNVDWSRHHHWVENPPPLTPFERERIHQQGVENNREIAEDLALEREQELRSRDRRADPTLGGGRSTDADGLEEQQRVLQQPTVTYVPPPADPQYRPDGDYPSVVLANTRVLPAETVDEPWAPRQAAMADSARFEMQLAIAQQVAANQVRAQQRADAEAAERLTSAALGQYIAPPGSAPERNVHR